MKRPPKPADWTRCHTAGMTAKQAAEELGVRTDAAYRWSSKNKTRWADDTTVCPVDVRGTIYPSMASAARALGVTTQTLCGHLAKYGNLDLAGLGKNRNRRSNQLKRPITILGVTYPSRKALAEVLGVDGQYVIGAINKGRIHRLEERLLVIANKRTADAYRQRLSEQDDRDKAMGICDRRGTYAKRVDVAIAAE